MIKHSVSGRSAGESVVNHDLRKKDEPQSWKEEIYIRSFSLWIFIVDVAS